jgi:membrane-associated protein
MTFDFILDPLLSNTYPILTFSLFIGSFGIPVPETLLVLAAGAFAYQGFANLGLVILTATLTSIGGDSACFFVGSKLRKYAGRLPPGISKQLAKGRGSINVCDTRMIFLSRFIFTPLGSPINLLSGMGGCSYQRFIPYVITGEFIWATGTASVGYYLGSSIEMIYEYTSNLTAIALIALGAYLVWQRIK